MSCLGASGREVNSNTVAVSSENRKQLCIVLNLFLVLYWFKPLPNMHVM